MRRDGKAGVCFSTRCLRLMGKLGSGLSRVVRLETADRACVR